MQIVDVIIITVIVMIANTDVATLTDTVRLANTMEGNPV